MARRQQRRKPTTNQLRIIAGQWRGRRLSFPDVPGLRPTPDRVRETLFNWLQGRVAGARCLDLFAGSGALGLEALSRGAASAVFVERDPAAARSLRTHCEHLGATAQVDCRDALDWLAQQPDQDFDLVFLDPPFHQDLALPCLRALSAAGWLRGQARIYLESEHQWAPDEWPPGYRLEKEKRAGQVVSRLLVYVP